MDTLPVRDARLLRVALLANASFSSLCALALFAAPAWISAALAQPPAWVLPGLGVGLLGFAAGLIWQARRPEPRLALALATVVADLMWLVGSGVLLALVELPSEGRALVLGVAAMVGLIAFAQLAGMRRYLDAPDPERGTQVHYRISLEVEGTPQDLWPVLAELDGIPKHAANIDHAELDGEPGPGAVRRCSAGSQSWTEKVVDWQPSRGLELRFGSEAGDFPYPIAPMFGGWQLRDCGSGRTLVTVWWSFTTRPDWAAPVIVALMDIQMPGDMRAAIRSMARAAAREFSSGANS